MNASINTKTLLFNHMQNGAVVITPNNRLSQQLLDTFYQHQTKLQAVTLSVKKPLCFSYSTFLEILFKQLQHRSPTKNHPILLTSAQERYLWQRILKNSSSNHHSLIDPVIDAWRRCQQWNISYDHALFDQTPQYEQFKQWVKQFEKQLKIRHAITHEHIVSHFLANPTHFESHTVIWACFDDYTPQQQALMANMQTQGCCIHHYDIVPKNTKTLYYPAIDHHDEWKQIAHWLKQGVSAKKQLAVVVPELHTQCEALKRFLTNYFADNEFNISLGAPLISYSLVSHALTCLGLKKTLLNHEVRLLLHSPYIKGARQEMVSRAKFMQEHFLLKEETILQDKFTSALATRTPQLASVLSTLQSYPSKASIKEWVHYFKIRLKQLGFPGEYAFNSENYQCFQRFMALFDEYLAIAFVQNTLTQDEALELLTSLARHVVFQPKRNKAPIQILGLLEASGCEFDGIWICGLTNHSLPQAISLSSFIPIELQKKYRLPHACPERELQFAQKTLKRFQHASEQCILSFAQLTGDIQHLPSPLIRHFPLFQAVTTDSTRSCKLVKQEEIYVLPLQEQESWSGGTSVLANQAKCPFRAFAQHRLHLKGEPLIHQGPDASERGQVLHHIMDILWKKIQNQYTLKTLAPTVLKQYITDAIQIALRPVLEKRSLSFPTLVQEVEIQRLTQLVELCLNLDKERMAFEIEALEKTFTLQLGELHFQVRIDRLDKDAQQNKWVIDYKTSLPAQKPWNEERPEFPQILLYALIDEAINTLMFIELKKGQLTCSGLSEIEQPIAGIQTIKKDVSWHHHTQQWQQILTGLAQEFGQGLCAPTPHRSNTCLSCEFQNLCRT